MKIIGTLQNGNKLVEFSVHDAEKILGLAQLFYELKRQFDEDAAEKEKADQFKRERRLKG